MIGLAAAIWAARPRVQAAPQPGAAPSGHVCPFCHQGRLDEECDCHGLCHKLQCRHRYTVWDGTWCCIAYPTEGFRKPAVPDFTKGEQQ